MRGSFHRTSQVPVSVGEVWAVLHDVDRLAAYSENIGKVGTIEPGSRWTTYLQDRVGLLKLSAPMEVAIVEESPEESISIRASGRDRGPGTRLTVEATMLLQANGEATHLTLEGTYELTGRATRLGAGVARRQAEKMVDEFWGNVTEDLEG